MKHNGSTYDQRHYRFERTCPGFHVERKRHWGDTVVGSICLVITLIGLIAWLWSVL